MGSQRIVGIEGLRGIAAGGVVLCHFALDGPHHTLEAALAVPLKAGVELFFALSAFLLYRPFASAILSGSPLPSVRRFLIRRARRIMPAYVAWVLLCSLVLGVAVTSLGTGAEVAGFQHDPEILLSDVLLLQNARASTVQTGLTAAWSLEIEAAFYLCLPLLAITATLLARRLATRTRSLAVFAPPLMVLILGVGTKLALSLLGSDLPSDTQRIIDGGFLGYAHLFAPGMALAALVAQRGTVVSAAIRGRVTLAVLVAGPPILYLGTFTLPDGVLQPLLTLPAAGLIALVVLHDGSGPGRLARLLDRRAPRTAGLISYSTFLIGIPVIILLGRAGLYSSGAIGILPNLVLTIITCGTLASLSHRLIEQPFMKNSRSKASTSTPASASPIAAPSRDTSRRRAA